MTYGDRDIVGKRVPGEVTAVSGPLLSRLKVSKSKFSPRRGWVGPRAQTGMATAWGEHLFQKQPHMRQGRQLRDENELIHNPGCLQGKNKTSERNNYVATPTPPPRQQEPSGNQ